MDRGAGGQWMSGIRRCGARPHTGDQPEGLGAETRNLAPQAEPLDQRAVTFNILALDIG